MSKQVLKFGGSVLCDAEGIYAAAAVAAEWQRQHQTTVVVSATKGSTDALLASAEIAVHQLPNALQRLQDIHNHHEAIAKTLLSGNLLHALITELNVLHEENIKILQRRAQEQSTACDLAALLASGEKRSALIFVAILRSLDCKAKQLSAESLVATDDNPLSATIDFARSEAQFSELFSAQDSDEIIVIPGFTGADIHGNTTILGRNASDYSAAVVARFAGDELIIFGDTDGVYTTDPNKFVFAQPLTSLSIKDAEWLARSGAPVVHPRTFEPLKNRNITVQLRALHSRQGGTRFSQDAPRTAALITVQPLRNTTNQLNKSNLQLPKEAAEFVAQHRAICPPDTVLVSALLPHENQNGLPNVVAHNQLIASHYIADLHAYLLLLPTDQVARVVRQLHDIAHTHSQRVAVGVIGASGRIGKQVIQLITQQRNLIEKQFGIRLDIVAACNSRTLLTQLDDSDASIIQSQLTDHSTASLSTDPAQALVSTLLRHHSQHRLLVDTTASADIAALYSKVLAHGVGVVTPNKIANASSTEQYNTLQTLSHSTHTPYSYETTVGAALPVLKTIAELKRAGDEIETITAALSGTIGYVLTRIQQGELFSVAVQEAVDKGYAEPNPLLDLCGEDVARKLLVLLRTAGFVLERDHIHVESLVNLAQSDSHELREQDNYWKARVQSVKNVGKKLVYVAQFEHGIARVGLKEVEANSPFFQLNAVENCLMIQSRLYHHIPLCIRGPGAGIEVTAAGVLNDIVEAARTLVARNLPKSIAA